MKFLTKPLFVACVFATWMISAAGAQQDTVVATVNGDPITQADVDLAFDTFGAALEQVPETDRRTVLINIIAETRLIADAAKDAGLDDTAEFKRQLAWMRAQALRIAFIQEKVAGEITDDELQKRYDALTQSAGGGEEIRARHILLKTRADALAVLKELNEGADFAELAKQKSTGPSGPRGGDLGFFGRGRMVPAFEAAAFAIEPGKFGPEPVQTQFGFHIIKVEEKRTPPQPGFDEVKEQLRSAALRERIETAVDKLRDKATIEIK